MKLRKIFTNTIFWCLIVTAVGGVMIGISFCGNIDDNVKNIIISLGGGFVASGVLAVLLDVVNINKRKREIKDLRLYFFGNIKNLIFVAISAGFHVLENKNGLIVAKDVLIEIKKERTKKLITDLHRFSYTTIEFLCRYINNNFFDKRHYYIANNIITTEEMSKIEINYNKLDLYLKYMNIDNFIEGIEGLCEIPELRDILQMSMVNK